MSVEVERKFVCNADTVKTLEEIGGRFSMIPSGFIPFDFD